VKLTPLSSALFALVLLPAGARAQPKADRPLLSLEAQGPTAQVTALAFSPNGRTLYAAGFDKVVRAWKLQNGRFVLDTKHPGYRVPVGPGTVGVINAITVSPDGAWLAVSGKGLMRNEAGFDQPGFIIDADLLTDKMWEDRGVIYVFNLRAGDAPVRELRGHRGEVLALAFAPAVQGKPLRLVSAARELKGRGPNRFAGQVRLWDVERQTSLPPDEAPLPPALQRPGLACWYAGARLQVAVTWGTGKLRLWQPEAEGDVAAREVVDVQSELIQPLALWQAGGQDRLLTCSWQKDAQISSWATEPVRRLRSRALRTPGAQYVLPMALAVVSSHGDGTPDHAAVAARLKLNDDSFAFRLYLVRLADFKVVAETKLWDWTGPGLPWTPVLAAAPGGGHLALAGNDRHDIWVYSIRDLLAGKATPAHLVGVGTTVRSLTFTGRGQGRNVALYLSGGARTRPGAPTALTEGPRRLVFDFLAKKLTPYGKQQGWQATSPQDAGWKVVKSEEPVRGQPRWHFEWTGPNGRRGTFDVPQEPGEELTDFALVPPLKLKGPVLAVATWNGNIGEPRLVLYNGKSRPFRHLTGHRDRIHALAAAPDGRLLASAGQDQTVCLWGLTDLDAISGRHGTPAGVVVDDAPGGKSLVVLKVQGDGGLQKGDRIAGQLFPGEEVPRPFASRLEFYDAVWRMRPESTLKLRVLRAGRPETATLKVAQGIDDRKPLLSLFITANPKERQWIAWTPSGPYDRSSDSAERFLGWHFNVGKPQEPTRFAAARDYRTDFHEPRLLPALARTASLPEALELLRQKPVPQTSLDTGVFDDGIGPLPPGQGGQVLVRHREVVIDLHVGGANLRENQVETITRQVGKGKTEPLDLSAAQGQHLFFKVELPEKRGVYPVLFRLRTREDEPREVTETVYLRYQPPPPAVEFDVGWLRDLEGKGHVVSRPALTVRAHVSKGEEAAVFLTHNGERIPLGPGPEIRKELKLTPGDNLLKLQAVNRDALKDFVADETSPERSLVIHYREEGKLTLALREVVTAGGDRLTVQPGTPLVVDTPKVRVVGQIQGAGKLVTAGWERKKPKAGGPLHGFKPGTAASQAIDEDVTLEPGPQELRFFARTEGKEASKDLAITYRPPLPAVTLPGPQERIEGRDGNTLDLVAGMTSPGHALPFRVTVLAPGEQRQVAVDAGKLPAGRAVGVSLGKVRLRPGRNEIVVRLENDWGARLRKQTEVRYRVPPRIRKLTSPQAAGLPKGTNLTGKPTLDLRAEVDSPTPQGQPQATLSGLNLPAGSIALMKLREEEGRTLWQVDVRGVPLHEGDNALTLVARNDDGPCLEPKTLTVPYRAPRRPPTISFRGLGDNLEVQDPAYTVRFHVDSERPLQKVELTVTSSAGRKAFLAPALAGRLQGDVEQAVDLEPGVNEVQVVAVTDEGLPQLGRRVLSYVPRPARLKVEAPRSPAPECRITLKGQVTWDLPAEGKLVEQRLRQLVVYVNGFRQLPAAVERPDPKRKELRFTVEVRLTHAEGNEIEVDCPGLPLAQGGRHEFLVDCQHPEPLSTLHLLVVGIDKDDRDMEQRALNALQVPSDQRALRNAVFSKIIMHPYAPGRQVKVVAGYVRQRRVKWALDGMAAYIARHRSPTDVVLVYWLGAQAVDKQGELYLPTSETRPGEALGDTAIPLRELLTACQDMLGAQVLLFDVARGKAPLQMDLATTRAAVLRGTWLREEPYPGLLEALQRASDTGRPASLEDVAKAARQLREQYQDTLRLQDNLGTIPSLATLVVSQRVPRLR
jgi:WD40 repeat protein